MIEINLLPEAMRNQGSMHPRRLAAIAAMALLLAAVAFLSLRYATGVIPELENRRRLLTAQRAGLQKQIEELAAINAEIERTSAFVNTVRELYLGRIVWSKVLSDIKRIVNFDPAMSEYNQDLRYLWLTKINGQEKNVSLSGFATASTQVLAMQLPERLLERFRTYAPVSAPERDEETKLQGELRAAMAAHEAQRRESPELPIQGARELAIRQRLAEIKDVKSGGIALLPFSSLVAPGTLKLLDTTWTNAPQPRRKEDGTQEVFPKNAWSFNVSLTLK